MRTQRWYWPGILALPAAGLTATEILSLQGLYPGETLAEQIRTYAGWGLWVASPFLVVVAMMFVAVRRDRLAWWLSLGTAAAVTVTGLYFGIAYRLDTSDDPLAGLLIVVGPLVALVPAVVVGVVVVVLGLQGRRNPGVKPV